MSETVSVTQKAACKGSQPIGQPAELATASASLPLIRPHFIISMLCNFYCLLDWNILLFALRVNYSGGLQPTAHKKKDQLEHFPLSFCFFAIQRSINTVPRPSQQTARFVNALGQRSQEIQSRWGIAQPCKLVQAHGLDRIMMRGAGN